MARNVTKSKPKPLMEKYLRLYDNDVVNWLRTQADEHGRTVIEQIKYTLRRAAQQQEASRQ